MLDREGDEPRLYSVCRRALAIDLHEHLGLPLLGSHLHVRQGCNSKEPTLDRPGVLPSGIQIVAPHTHRDIRLSPTEEPPERGGRHCFYRKRPSREPCEQWSRAAQHGVGARSLHEPYLQSGGVETALLILHPRNRLLSPNAREYRIDLGVIQENALGACRRRRGLLDRGAPRKCESHRERTLIHVR